ncbi:hypothetical protein CF327_g7543 [Tilletia walkeri]|nr:hypothetical protein CF327_g7543 [Tilletia walkeri]
MAPTSKAKEAPGSASSSVDAAAQVPTASDQPSMADIYQAIMSVRQQVANMGEKIETVEFEVASQKLRLDSLTSGIGKTTYDTSFKTPSSQVMVEDKTQAPLRHLGQGFVSPTQYGLHAGTQGGPFGLTPRQHQSSDARVNRGRISFGVSGFPLPPQAQSPSAQRGQAMVSQTTRFTSTPYKSVPRDTDPTMVGVKEDLMEVHRDYARSIHPDWSEDQVEKEATNRTAEDYLALRKRAIEEAMDGQTQKAVNSQGHDSGHVKPRINIQLEHVPGAIGILEGMIYGPKYLDPDDSSFHPDYDEALDLEIGQVIQTSIEQDVKSLLLKPISEQELRGSVFYRELRTWLVPNQGYAALKLLTRLGRHRQREGESVRQFGERLRRFYIELQSAGEALDQNKQTGLLLGGLSDRFESARSSIVSKQAQGEQFTFDRTLRVLCESEESFGAFDNRKGNTRTVPPFSRASAHLVEDDHVDMGSEDDDEDTIQALAAQFARNLIGRQKEQRPFTKACFCCKKVGHRASECPGDKDDAPKPTPSTAPRAFAAEAQQSSKSSPIPHTCGKDDARASLATTIPALGAFEAQVWEDELEALPTALNVMESA